MTTNDDSNFVELWYADEAVPSIDLVKAYPRQGDTYWVPEKGVQCSKGFSLFDTRPEARARVIGILNGNLSKVQILLAKAEKL